MLHAEQVVAMVKRLLLVITAAACAGLVGAADATPAAQARIEMTAVPRRATLGFPPTGRAGDRERVRWSLRDRYGRVIGIGLFSCQWFAAQERVCWGVVNLPLGTIAVQGQSLTRELGTWAVTGGTGRYSGIDGELRFAATGFQRLNVQIDS